MEILQCQHPIIQRAIYPQQAHPNSQRPPTPLRRHISGTSPVVMSHTGTLRSFTITMTTSLITLRQDHPDKGTAKSRLETTRISFPHHTHFVQWLHDLPLIQLIKHARHYAQPNANTHAPFLDIALLTQCTSSSGGKLKHQ
jgi:hypothetical protein